MKASELIAKLQELPGDTEIYTMDEYNAEVVTIDRIAPFTVINRKDRDHGKMVIWPGGPEL